MTAHCLPSGFASANPLRPISTTANRTLARVIVAEVRAGAELTDHQAAALENRIAAALQAASRCRS